MNWLDQLIFTLQYPKKVIQIDDHENGTADLWRHDGEASAEVYMDLSLDWASRATNELGEHTIVYHDDRATALRFAISLITDYHLKWREMGLLTQREAAPPITGVSNQGNAERYTQRDH